jgi:Raf kinase inhibitor-like YbhB/YbcL family protein
MNLELIDFTRNNKIKKEYLCKNHGGQDISPHIYWKKITNAKSYALILEDPDAVGKNFDHRVNLVHWYIPFISPEINEILELNHSSINNLQSINFTKINYNKINMFQARNTIGKFGYHGPCAPKDSGIHHYKFTIFALNGILPINDSNIQISGSSQFRTILAQNNISILSEYSFTFQYYFGMI